MKKKLICILDDDELSALFLQRQLERRRYFCIAFSNSLDFFAWLESGAAPGLIILDYFLGNERCCGLDVCVRVKAELGVPVIMLTGDCRTRTIVDCLNAGADQYVTKPYNIDELVARIGVVFRLCEGKGEKFRPHEILSSGIRVNWDERRLSTAHGCEVSLTEKELALLALFLASDEAYVDRERAFSTIYGLEREPLNRAIDVLISRLRKKLVLLGDAMDIVTVRGGGYFLVLSSAKSEVRDDNER